MDGVSLVNCDKVTIHKDSHGGMGAFASSHISKGELVEDGIVRRLNNCDGHENPHLFTWSNERPNTIWALVSGKAAFYNTIVRGEKPTVRVTRYFEEDRFEIHALKDIRRGEELTHEYLSKEWRKCFIDLNTK